MVTISLSILLLCIFASKVLAQNRFLRDADRALEGTVTLPDPKTVVVKTEEEKTVWRYPLAPETLKRRLIILSFGSSHTIGYGLKDPRHQAYPFLLGEPGGHVVNVALKATGADYPSVCLQSMFPNSEWLNFDLITLEFRSCGDDSFELLLKRIRDRYPDAVIIFVHLWHLLFLNEKESGMTPDELGKNPDLNWTFNNREPCASPWMVSVAEKYGAYVYRLPENPRQAIDNNWFQDDWNHLTEAGHMEIANGILEILSHHQEELFKKRKKLGSFGLGGQCMSWYQDGGKGLSVDVDGVNIAEKTKFIRSFHKYAVEMDSLEGGVITFESNLDELVPVDLMIMTLKDGKYSVAEVCVNNKDPIVIDPNFNAHGHPDEHVVMLHQVGFAQKGRNSISVRIIDARERPFRVTGLVLCGVCSKAGTKVEQTVWRYPLAPGTLKRRLIILSLGSSHTWGAGLEDRRKQSYPFLLGEPGGHVVNLALRATGADYPSVCLQSMIPDSNINFDVITLEFRSCGDGSFEFLLKRIRERYPDAVIIFVHLWHLLFLNEKESGMTPDELGKNPELDWIFIHGVPCASPWMVSIAEKYGAYVYRLPENPRQAIDNNWFQDDWHHPTEAGHMEIANGILEILSHHQEELFKSKRVGSFGLGDQCMSWYQDGGKGLSVDVDGVNIAEKTKLIGSGNKYAVEMDSLEGGVITFESNLDELVPIGLMVMSLKDGKYSVAEVQVNNQDAVKIDPNFNSHAHPRAHVAMLHQVGFAQKGRNSISVRIIDARERPFRVTGLVLCGVCSETGTKVQMMQTFVNFDLAD
jgi:hypothetical protein